MTARLKDNDDIKDNDIVRVQYKDKTITGNRLYLPEHLKANAVSYVFEDGKTYMYTPHAMKSKDKKSSLHDIYELYKTSVQKWGLLQQFKGDSAGIQSKIFKRWRADKQGDNEYFDIVPVNGDNDIYRVKKDKKDLSSSSYELEKVVVKDGDNPTLTLSMGLINSKTLQLYPDIVDDEKFNEKISLRTEFRNYPYEANIPQAFDESAFDKAVNTACSFGTILPHQKLVRNFLSVNTPYNSLLLYHGLGSGKTCTAIVVAEEMRQYNKQMNNDKRIVFLSNFKVRDNFKSSFFDQTKLQFKNGLWTLGGCVGEQLLKEIKTHELLTTDATKESHRQLIIEQLQDILKRYYVFYGYREIANLTSNILLYKHNTQHFSEIQISNNGKMMYGSKAIPESLIQKWRAMFEGCLFVIDEVHNINESVTTDEAEDSLKKKKKKKTAPTSKVASKFITLLTHFVPGIRLLFLSATPMANSPDEIIFLLNLMLVRDKRPELNGNTVFNRDGSFNNSDTNPNKRGEDILKRSATGYVSFVRGENPITFPYRIWPNEFAQQNTFIRGGLTYPTTLLGDLDDTTKGNTLEERLFPFMVETGSEQMKGY